MMSQREIAVTSAWAFARYEAVRHRLPVARFPETSVAAADLGALTETFDAFVFDSFGVLNVGETPIPGARERIDGLRAAGKRVFILTNAATVALAKLDQKYATLGFDFQANEIVSSREVLARALANHGDIAQWGVAAPPISDIAELPVSCHPLDNTAEAFERSEGFIVLSSAGWTDALLTRLEIALKMRPRPLLIGNPDLVAPREAGFTVEPGAYAHDLADALGIEPVFFGKPFANAFDVVTSRLEPSISPERVAMIGDTLHTDVLGGAAAGWRSILVTDYGLMKDLDIPACIASSGIVPDFIVPQI